MVVRRVARRVGHSIVNRRSRVGFCCARGNVRAIQSAVQLGTLLILSSPFSKNGHHSRDRDANVAGSVHVWNVACHRIRHIVHVQAVDELVVSGAASAALSTLV